MGDMNFSLTTFNKTGKLMQIEYALARVQQGKMALGIKGTKDHGKLSRFGPVLIFSFSCLQPKTELLLPQIARLHLYLLIRKSTRRFKILPLLQVIILAR